VVNIACIYYFLVRKRVKFNPLYHIVLPLVGLAVVGYAWTQLGSNAMRLGLIWIGVGIVYFAYLKFIRKVDIKLGL